MIKVPPDSSCSTRNCVRGRVVNSDPTQPERQQTGRAGRVHRWVIDPGVAGVEHAVGLGYDIVTVGGGDDERQVGELTRPSRAWSGRTYGPSAPMIASTGTSERTSWPTSAVASPTGQLSQTFRSGLRPYVASNPISLAASQAGAVGSANGAMSWQSVLNTTPSARWYSGAQRVW